MVSPVANAPLAQLAEQRTLNPRVRGSSPWRRTRDQGSDLAILPRSEPFSRPLWTLGCSVGALEPLDETSPGRTGRYGRWGTGIAPALRASTCRLLGSR